VELRRRTPAAAATGGPRLRGQSRRSDQAADRDPATRIRIWDPLARDQYLEIRTLLSGYLLASQGDRVAMASSVEGRFPFLDVEVIELACSLPPNFKLRVLDEKHVLKRAATGLVPESIIRRPKQPYRARCDRVLRQSTPAGSRGSTRPLRARSIFDPDAVLLWTSAGHVVGALSNRQHGGGVLDAAAAPS
jgi:asparagine synthetase B (glutamine-hydrolysing)